MNIGARPIAHSFAQSRLRAAAILAGCGLLLGGGLGGCLSRHLSITSEPTGARVILNDVEVGRTPVTVPFTFYGDYDVRLEHDGFEPLATHKRVRAPWYEYPPIDLLMTVLPFGVETEIDLHFELKARTAEGDAGLEERARELRDREADGG